MLPDSVAHLFLALFLGSLGIFVLIPAGIGYWRLAHGSLSPARQGLVRLEDIPATALALVLINIFCYILGSGSAHPIPPDTLRILLAALDLLFGLFLLDIVIVSLLTRQTKQRVTSAEATSSQVPTNEALNRSETSSIVRSEETIPSSVDGVSAGDN
jgi:hypothetical protein